MPDPDRAERRALPAHLRPAAAALFDGLPDRLEDGVVERTQRRLSTGAEELTTSLPPGTELMIDAFRLRSTAACSAAGIENQAEPFAWTPAIAARTLGLRAVAYHLRGDGEHGPVEVAVAAVVADLIAAAGGRTPGPWLAQLSPPAQAVAVAQARRWAEQALTWLPLRLVGNRELRFLQDDWWRPRGRPIGKDAARAARLVLHGRRDITVNMVDRSVAATVAGGTAYGPGLADVDALTALAGVLCDPNGRLVRVVRVHPASGEVVAVDVTPALLERAVDVVLATAATLRLVVAGVEPQASPGVACTWCHRRETCPSGVAWLARPDRRVMGLPLLALRV